MASKIYCIPRLMGEAGIVEVIYSRSHVRRCASRMRKWPTSAERGLALVLNSLSGGVLKRRFRRQHVVSGRWIVDFFFPEIRLAIEVDGSFHWSQQQRKLDQEKDKDCARFDITLLRLTNSEVFGERDILIERLRHGWRTALQRSNKVIGKQYPIGYKGPYFE